MREDRGVDEERTRAMLAGAVSAAGGLAVAEVVAGLLGLGTSPVLAIGEQVIVLTPGGVAEAAIQAVGTWDKPLLVVGTVVGALAVGALAGVLARRRFALGIAVLAAMAVAAGWSAMVPADSGSGDVLPAAAAFVVAVLLLSWLTDAVRTPAGPADPGRRRFLLRAGTVAAGAVVVATVGRYVGAGRRAVEDARRAVAVTLSRVRTPPDVEVGVPGVPRWRTSNETFYRIDTALAVPHVLPTDWSLRIHGLVEREITLTYDELVERGLVDAWITLCCVSNEVGGSLIGNAQWTGVPVADLLAEAGVDSSADAVLQTSADGWSCGTPIEAVTDDRNALLAVGMNGEPLPIEHGFPVRMVVPGLYGFVSATKWVVDLEVTRFADFSAYWTERGWSERGPVKTQSRIDVPRGGASLAAGQVAVGGVAWAQHTGIDRVEVRVDDEPWQAARLASVPNVDTWRQWAWVWDATPGEHSISVRATDTSGYTQTGEEQDVVPDGATGWHRVEVSVE
jgi:DMSO/TMAO reductase YedYZ molybdopterin-dependent catalytic subunit